MAAPDRHAAPATARLHLRALGPGRLHTQVGPQEQEGGKATGSEGRHWLVVRGQGVKGGTGWGNGHTQQGSDRELARPCQATLFSGHSEVRVVARKRCIQAGGAEIRKRGSSTQQHSQHSPYPPAPP